MCLQQQTDKPLILQSGQGTAIVTGSISIIFGVAYLALVFLMDWRGGEFWQSGTATSYGARHLICTQ